MFKQLIASVLLCSSIALGQSMKIVQPLNSEFISLGSPVDITVQRTNPSGIIQIELCTFVTGQDLCSNGATLLLKAPSCAVNSTYTVPISPNQQPGLTKLIVSSLDGTTVTEQTSISIFLGAE